MGSLSKRLKYALLAPLFIISTLVMQFANVSFVSAATITWDGGGTDNNFSTAANWVGDVAPLVGDVLVFPSAGGASEVLVNDLGVAFASLTVNAGAGSAGSYTFDTLSLQNGATVTVDDTIGTDTTVVVTSLSGAGSLTVDGNGLLDVTTLNVATGLTVSSAFDGTTVTVGGNLTSSAAFTATTVTVTGLATFNTAVPTITTLSASSLISDIALAVTTLTLTGDYLSASTGTLAVSGTFTAPSADYTVNEAFTAGTFAVGGNLIVNVEPTVTTLSIVGDLTLNTDLSVTTLLLDGDLRNTSTGALTTTNFTANTSYTVSYPFTTQTFVVNGNLVVDNTYAATTSTTVTGNMTVSTGLTTADINVTGGLTIDETGTLSAQAMTVGGDLIVYDNSNTATSLDLTGNLTILNDTAQLSVNGDMSIAGTVSGSGYLNVSGTLSAVDDFTIPMSGGINAGTINVPGDLQVNDNNYYAIKYIVGGNVTIGSDIYYYYGGMLLADGSDITGDVTVVRGSLSQADGASISMNKLTVNNGATAQLNGTIDFPITFGSGSSKSLPSLTYNTYTTEWDGDLEKLFYDYSTLTFTGAITLKNDLKVLVNGDKKNGKVEFNGDITYNNFSIKKSNSSTGKLFIDGKEVKNPVITTEYNGEKWDVSAEVTENETATLNGTRSSISVYPGGVLKGEGTAIYGDFYHDATLSPGNSPGTITFLNTLTLQPDSVYYVELQDTDNYDQAVVGEEYTSSGNAVSITDAILTLALYDGYSMNKGDKFMIIDNRSDTDVLGTFTGLAEGATITLGGGEFTISYVGGDGNDVVLTVVEVPTATVGAPNTGILRIITANPLVSLTLGLTTAGILMLIARRKLATVQVR